MKNIWKLPLKFYTEAFDKPNHDCRHNGNERTDGYAADVLLRLFPPREIPFHGVGYGNAARLASIDGVALYNVPLALSPRRHICISRPRSFSKMFITKRAATPTLGITAPAFLSTSPLRSVSSHRGFCELHGKLMQRPAYFVILFLSNHRYPCCILPHQRRIDARYFRHFRHVNPWKLFEEWLHIVFVSIRASFLSSQSLSAIRSCHMLPAF